MDRNRIGTVVAAFTALALPCAAMAQERGRTDGPEGSEYGKGGYSAPGTNRFSLALDWGASFLNDSGPLGGNKDDGAPLFVGATASYWGDEWFALELSPAYLFDSQRVNVFAGPRFGTFGYPLNFSVGVQAGPVITPEDGTFFALSFQPAVNALVADHFVLGLKYAYDLNFGSNDGQRIFMNVGYRF